MSADVVLRCRECGAVDRPRAWFKLTKNGVLRLEGGTRFYVDGAGALCPEHKPDPLPNAQRESWSEFDRRNAMWEEET